MGVEQLAYVPVRTAGELGRNVLGGDSATVLQEHILARHDRAFFNSKIRKISSRICAKNLLDGVEIIHGHFLYSDGAVALKLHKLFGLPYVVTARNTDLNAFRRLRPDLRSLEKKILLSSAGITTLNHAYADKLLAPYTGEVKALISSKLSVIPNGIESEWLSFSAEQKKPASSQIKCLYVGDLSRNKNIESTILALNLLSRDFDVSLVVVGAGTDSQLKEFRQFQKQYSFLSYMGPIHDRQALMGVMREADVFAMPSFKESFGRVYIEALSQGLPIIYSSAQGVSGFFDRSDFARAVDPYDFKDIAKGLRYLISKRGENTSQCIDAAKQFEWCEVAKKYYSIYSGRVRPMSR
jgi:glycosyltransferase involved in cell wall biosynthesis